MSFHMVRFPLPLSFGARGGPERQTDIVQLASGHESRNSHVSQSRRRYDVGAGIKSLDDLHSLISFFEARHGQLYGFLFRDPMDFKSCPPQQEASANDQIIGQGDGVQTRFDLVKTYADDQGSYVRDISHPDGANVRVAIDGAPISSGSGSSGSGTSAISATWDAPSRQLVFTQPPQSGSVITAGFEFDVPVRFDMSQLDLSLESFGAGKTVNVALIEVLPYA